MQRELLLIAEMIDAGTEAHRLVRGTDLETLAGDRQRRDALLWNFTVLGEQRPKSTMRSRADFRRCPVGATLPATESDRPRLLVLDLEILHTTATDALPALVCQLRQVLAMLEAEHVDG